jgi:hypothetical protein
MAPWIRFAMEKNIQARVHYASFKAFVLKNKLRNRVAGSW